MKECWYISDNLNTSYTDVLDLSVQERYYLIECINAKADATQKAIDKKMAEINSKNKQ